MSELTEQAKYLIQLMPRLHKMISGRVSWPPHPLARKLTVSQMHAMGYLAARGPLTMRELAQCCQIAMPSASETADRLVRLGMAQRKSDPRDRRRVRLQVTAKGRKEFLAQQAYACNRFTKLLDTLDAGERRQLLNAFKIIERVLAPGRKP
ncbi:MAG: MarR family transcriptional regulator [candidate division FCPU426 bacterium]